MDRITKSYLSEFKLKYAFNDSIKEETLFEHLVNYTLLERKIDESLDDDLIEKINIGKNGTIGIDGFAILINGHLIFNKDDINLILDNNKKSFAEVVFIQSKTSANFDNKEIGLFGNAVNDFISETQNYNWSQNAIESIELFNHLISRVSDLFENPTCNLFFVCLGKINNEDENLNATKTKIILDISGQQIFESITFSYIDHSILQNDYKKIGKNITKSFEFSLKTLMPNIDNVKEAYIGVVPVTTIIDLIKDDDGNLETTIFYDNVRDFQGENKINVEIKNTLKDEKLKYAFSVLNNGVTIVSEKLVTSRNTFNISNYQIINGLQTSHMLFKNKEFLDSDIYVPIKLIVTQDE